MSKYLSTREFSEVTGMNIKAVYKNVRAGRIKAYRQSTSKSNYLIAESEAESFPKRKPLESNHVQPN
jgi:predicted site-specific integrase-resolvase